MIIMRVNISFYQVFCITVYSNSDKGLGFVSIYFIADWFQGRNPVALQVYMLPLKDYFSGLKSHITFNTSRKFREKLLRIVVRDSGT